MPKSNGKVAFRPEKSLQLALRLEVNREDGETARVGVSRTHAPSLRSEFATQFLTPIEEWPLLGLEIGREIC